MFESLFARQAARPARLVCPACPACAPNFSNSPLPPSLEYFTGLPPTRCWVRRALSSSSWPWGCSTRPRGRLSPGGEQSLATTLPRPPTPAARPCLSCQALASPAAVSELCAGDCRSRLVSRTLALSSHQHLLTCFTCRAAAVDARPTCSWVPPPPPRPPTPTRRRGSRRRSRHRTPTRWLLLEAEVWSLATRARLVSVESSPARRRPRWTPVTRPPPCRSAGPSTPFPPLPQRRPPQVRQSSPV